MPTKNAEMEQQSLFSHFFFSIWCSYEMLKTSNNLYRKAELSHDYIHAQRNETKIQEHAEKPLSSYVFPYYSFLLENQLQSPFTLMYFSV